MYKKYLSLPLLTFSLFTTAAENPAQYRAYNAPVNYNFASIKVGIASFDDTSLEANVIEGGGESMINENWIVQSYYTSALFNGTYSSALSSRFMIDALHRFPISKKVDIVLGGGLGYYWNDATYCYYSCSTAYSSDIGINAQGQIRVGLTDKLEGQFGFITDFVYEEVTTSFTAGAIYYLNTHFGIGVNYTSYDIGSAISADVRFKF